MTHDLTKVALLGTGRLPASGLTLAPHPADELVDQLAGEDREHLLLLRLGARAVCDQCGQIARRDIAPLSVAPPETAKVLESAKLVDLLETVANARNWPLLVEFLDAMAGEKFVLPPRLLPDLMGIGDRTVRAALSSTIGERGRWLSQFREDWEWARTSSGAADEPIDELQKRWDEGTANEREAALKALRRQQPDLARTWLGESIDKEKAETRLALLETLRVGLSAADQAFLEERQNDGSEKVRGLVADLLSLLPQSALAQRMRNRADALFQTQTTGLLRKKQTLVCSPPEEVDKNWERDGIAKKPPPGMGLKAFWIERVLAHVPPSHWIERFGGEPTALLQQIGDDPFAQNVVNGWTDAALHFADFDEASRGWLPALAAHWLSLRRQTADKDRRPVNDRVRALLGTMSPADAERAILPLFEEGPNILPADAPELLPAFHRPWSRDFSGKLLALVGKDLPKAVQKKNHVQIHYWVAVATIAAGAVAPELLAATEEAVRLPDGDEDFTMMVNRQLEDARLTIGRRRLFYETMRST